MSMQVIANRFGPARKCSLAAPRLRPDRPTGNAPIIRTPRRIALNLDQLAHRRDTIFFAHPIVSCSFLKEVANFESVKNSLGERGLRDWVVR